jgi:hypothetical protein
MSVSLLVAVRLHDNIALPTLMARLMMKIQ